MLDLSYHINSYCLHDNTIWLEIIKLSGMNILYLITESGRALPVIAASVLHAE